MVRIVIGCGLLLLLLTLQHRLWFGEHGYQELQLLEQENSRLEHENQLAAERNQALRAETDALAQGEQAIEARARSELGLIRPGETFVRIIPSDN